MITKTIPAEKLAAAARGFQMYNYELTDVATEPRLKWSAKTTVSEVQIQCSATVQTSVEDWQLKNIIDVGYIDAINVVN